MKGHSSRGRPSVPSAGRQSRRRFILVIGGAASGKSQHALDLAGRRGQRAFLATAEPLDQEMRERIRRHQLDRGQEWTTREVPMDLAKWVDIEAVHFRAIVIDCLTIWLSNLLKAGSQASEIKRLTVNLIDACRRAPSRLIMVTNELGMSLVPMEATSRRFRDLAGWMNQQVAAAADEVYFVVSGMSIRLK
jgi:adenosylcobinamide kinase/adenosylcobinamide-phosphate guanylyltransferase